MQLISGALALVAAYLAYKIARFAYDISRNAILLRHLPGPKYGVFLGVITHFASGKPITRYPPRHKYLLSSWTAWISQLSCAAA